VQITTLANYLIDLLLFSYANQGIQFKRESVLYNRCGIFTGIKFPQQKILHHDTGNNEATILISFCLVFLQNHVATA
jgi:hypothetical protein